MPVPQAASSSAPVPRAPAACAPVPQASSSASAAAVPGSSIPAPTWVSRSALHFLLTPSGSRTLRFRPPAPPPVSGTVPAECIHLCSSLALAVRTGRAQRAWDAGIAAGRLLRGEIDCVPPTPEITVRSRVYVVLRNPRGGEPSPRQGLIAGPPVGPSLKTSDGGRRACRRHGWLLHAICALVSFQDGSEARAFCIPVMRRAGGFLLALPTGCLSAQALAEGLDTDPVFGPSASLTVQAVEEGFRDPRDGPSRTHSCGPGRLGCSMPLAFRPCHVDRAASFRPIGRRCSRKPTI